MNMHDFPFAQHTFISWLAHAASCRSSAKHVNDIFNSPIWQEAITHNYKIATDRLNDDENYVWHVNCDAIVDHDDGKVPRFITITFRSQDYLQNDVAHSIDIDYLDHPGSLLVRNYELQGNTPGISNGMAVTTLGMYKHKQTSECE